MPKITAEEKQTIPETAANLNMAHVRAALAAHRIKREALAELTGVSRSYLSNILVERADGTRVRPHLYRALVALGLEREVRHGRH